MTPLIKTLVAAVSTTLLVAGAFAQSTLVNAENEPATVLTVLPPLPGPLAQGVVFIPYRLENLRIVPVGGAAARDISPRVGHLHITLDDLPWQWADYGGSNTVILVGLPRGEHKVRIEAVDPEGHPFVARAVTFYVPSPGPGSSPAEHLIMTGTSIQHQKRTIDEAHEPREDHHGDGIACGAERRGLRAGQVRQVLTEIA